MIFSRVTDDKSTLGSDSRPYFRSFLMIKHYPHSFQGKSAILQSYFTEFFNEIISMDAIFLMYRMLPLHPRIASELEERANWPHQTKNGSF